MLYLAPVRLGTGFRPITPKKSWHSVESLVEGDHIDYIEVWIQ